MKEKSFTGTSQLGRTRDMASFLAKKLQHFGARDGTNDEKIPFEHRASSLREQGSPPRCDTAVFQNSCEF